MISLAEVRLWGNTIGAVQWDTATALGVFEYSPSFLSSNIQLSPIHMPLQAGPMSFPGLRRESYKGLPGLLADALPDAFGNLLIDQWLVAQGRDPKSFNPVERLLYMGSRGMGALEFAPATARQALPEQALMVDELVRLANRALVQKEQLKTQFDHTKGQLQAQEDSLRQIISVGTSAGGARAKAVIAWNEETGEVRSGQLPCSGHFKHYLLKFDGVDGNRDKELADPQGYTRIEYAYYLLALMAGIHMMPSRLLEENGRAHFMTQRFDRTPAGEKLHMQTLCGLAHFDFNWAGGYSYEQCFQVMRQIGLAADAIKQQYLRMMFNVVFRNQDDHTKNIAFLMNKRGQWQLSPAYDVTFSYNPNGVWTSSHQMTVNGKRDQFQCSDLYACGRSADLDRSEVDDILGRLLDIQHRWLECAQQAGVSAVHAQEIAGHFRNF
ncbi:MAG: type II toxin-antitoxin system HipA family toxin [Oleibacter sp.]|nr:type II toxin-antitoxin system HipA family toxin [Thalassolituus sp.]